jgi:DNA-binding CsgD family transcriptional regulator
VRQEGATAAELQFVGRTPELGELSAALDAAEAGQAPVVVLHGETGVGKTQTASRFADQARDRGAIVLRGSCEVAGPLAWCPWDGAIADAAEQLGSDRLQELAGADAQVLAMLLRPGLTRPASSSANALSPEEARLRLPGAVARLLESIGGPLVLILDDLQRAPAASLDILSYVARHAPSPMLLLIYRGRELDISYPLARSLGEVTRTRHSHYLRLEGLPLADATALLEFEAREAVEPALAEALHGASRGSPLFLGSFGDDLRGGGAVLGPGEWRPPEAVRQAVAVRLAEVSQPARSVLELASVFGGSFALDELLLLAEVGEEALLLSLDEALAADVIRRAGADRYEFAHGIVRLTLRAGLSPSRAARLHRRLADGMERMYAGRTDEMAGELARQYHESGSIGGSERGVQHALEAAAQARAAHAPSDAADFSRIALDLAARDGAERISIMERLALAEAEAGRLDDARRTLADTLELAGARGDTPEQVAGLAHRVLSELRLTLPHQNSLEPLIATGLDALGDARTLAWARLKLLERPHEEARLGAFHWLRWSGLDAEAVRVVREEGSEADYADSIDWNAPLTLAELEELTRRIDFWSDTPVKLRGLIALSHHLFLLQGSTNTVELLCVRCETLAEELAAPAGKAVAAIQHAMVFGEQGRFEEAAGKVAEARALGARVGAGTQIDVFAALVGALTAQHVRPEWSQAGRLAERLASTADPIFFGIACAAFASHAFAQAGMSAEARELAGQTTAVLLGGGLAPYAESIALSLTASAVWKLHDSDLAERLLACGVDREGQADWYMASSELAAARLSSVLGRHEEAAAYFSRARQTLSRREQRPLSAVVDHDESLARRSGRQPSSRLMASAKAQFDELDMAVWSAQTAIEEASEKLPDQLTAREAEVLRHMAGGSTNRKIAADLVLSVHTVERHLTNAYRKIGAHNRAEATAYVVRTDL